MKGMRHVIVGIVLALVAPLHAATSPSGLRAAAITFSSQADVGMPADASATRQNILRVEGDLKSTVLLFQDGDQIMCLLSSAFPVNVGALQTACHGVLAKELGLPSEAIVAASTHAHTIPLVKVQNAKEWGQPGAYPVSDETNEMGRRFLLGLAEAARGLREKLAPVSVEWGVEQETRVTYNRRGRRPDGTSYFIREEDRVKLGEDYVGMIDSDATVVVLTGAERKPVAAMAFFSGHPVSAYNPEAPISWGQWPQVACDKLSAHLGGVPVAFVQGCAGDINSKYMLTGTLEQAIELGEFLGDSYIKAASHLKPSQRTGFAWERTSVDIPLDELPPTETLQRELDEIDDFIRRCRQGDLNTKFCVGMNFPDALTPPYRAQLVQMVRPWYVWALDQRASGLTASLPKAVPLPVVVARFGDVGYVGMPWEAFTRTARLLKDKAPLPCVLTATYVEGGQGYIPDATAVNDREYQAGFFRYLGTRPPYKAPAGDAVVEVAVPALQRLSP